MTPAEEKLACKITDAVRHCGLPYVRAVAVLSAVLSYLVSSAVEIERDGFEAFVARSLEQVERDHGRAARVEFEQGLGLGGENAN